MAGLMADDDIRAVTKIGVHIPMSREMLAEAEEFWAAHRRYLAATPEEREQWAREAAERRAAERAATGVAHLTLGALIARMGWPWQYAHHLVQPYCDCSDGSDGWDYCQHARDLRFDRDDETAPQPEG